MAHQDLVRGKVVSHFVVDKKLGEGGFGQTYSVIDQETHQMYAMKIEYMNSPNKVLTNEIRVLYELRGNPHFPQFIDDGVEDDFFFVVMDIFGPSLSKMRKRMSGNKFSLTKTLTLGIEMLHAIEALHEKGYVHCDIKPSNFLVSPRPEHSLVLIDFGLSEKFIDRNTHSIRSYKNDCGFVGTYTYSSVHVHKGKRYSPRDDLISWFYSLIEMAKGSLPWDTPMDPADMKSAKERISFIKICRHLPIEFDKIYLYLKKLKYSSKPNYGIIEHFLKSAIKKTDENVIMEENREFNMAMNLRSSGTSQMSAQISL
ncbi:CK1 family protein kinase [Histomonas meleagridis]|uniref:CK1 family protein kinase n=1 Tax=Histomonas meleagridis TaxID=135588 RepID=UPI00355A82C5|nr:CK1 family protein kinase [Histomonas meleagridis]KAH0796117.1 CK1 family protein kinase [Histomonas meleagridis]